MIDRCIVCRGTRTVRLPIYHPIVVSLQYEAPALDMRETSRDYPCPECGTKVDLDRVMVVKDEGWAHRHIDNPGYLEHVRYDLAHAIVQELLNKNYIKFERDLMDDQRLGMKATMAVVAPSVIATIEERTQQHQLTVATEVANEAIRSINHWGSYYNSLTLTKENAARQIRESLTKVTQMIKERWKADDIKR